MIKVALFDLDGLVMVGRKHYFSHQLSEEFNIPIAEVEEFFLNDFSGCIFGRKDLKEEIAPYIPKWGWKGSVDDLLTYWFESENTKDEEVLKIVSDIRAKDIKCYIATRQEKYRMKYLLEEVGLKDHFDGNFCTCDIGYDKNQPEFFEYVFKDLGVKPEEVLFLDDSEKNIKNAKNLGMDAHLYTDISVLKDVFESRVEV